jgi:hypothetical protein
MPDVALAKDVPDWQERAQNFLQDANGMVEIMVVRREEVLNIWLSGPRDDDERRILAGVIGTVAQLVKRPVVCFCCKDKVGPTNAYAFAFMRQFAMDGEQIISVVCVKCSDTDPDEFERRVDDACRREWGLVEAQRGTS